MHLGDFSLLNNPPWAVTRETLTMLTSVFAECCGHIVLYGAPAVFRGVFAAVRPFVDPRTATKILFAAGDGSDDALMRDVIGADWRRLTGAGGARAAPRSSPGYAHATHWRSQLDADAAWRRRAGNAGPLSHAATNWPADVPFGDERAAAAPAPEPDPPAPADEPPARPRQPPPPPPPPPPRRSALLGILERVFVVALACAVAQAVALRPLGVAAARRAAGTNGTCYAARGRRVPLCACHPTCATCGYYRWPDGPSDCVTCADGSRVKARYGDGTGTCGS